MKNHTSFIPPIHLSILLFLLFWISCNQSENQQDKTVSKTEQSRLTDEQIELELPALYTGTLPCADCPGINYQLIIEKGKFTEISHYQDRSVENLEEIGKWEIDGDTLTLRGEEDLILKRFLIDDSNLRLLNRNNQQITGDLAEMFVLDRAGNQPSIREHHKDLAHQGYTFYASGNEPFWSLKIDSLNQVIFESPKKEIKLGKVSIITIRSEMHFETATDSTQLFVQIQDTYCQDSMSGYLYPLTITAKMESSQADSLQGCGLFLEF